MKEAREFLVPVIPAKAGIQRLLANQELDSDLRRNDEESAANAP
jgi:hypothetical protein